jgi:hypothetical protein
LALEARESVLEVLLPLIALPLDAQLTHFLG